jgi:hypothetical protein
VAEPRGEPGLVEKHRQERGLLDELGLELLDDDELVEAAGALDHRQVDDAHAAARDLRDQLVLAKHRTRTGQHPDGERTPQRRRAGSPLADRGHAQRSRARRALRTIGHAAALVLARIARR